MHEESAQFTSCEAVVCHFRVSFICDNAIVACFFNSVSNHNWANIWIGWDQLWHLRRLVLLHLLHALLSASHEFPVIIVLIFLVESCATGESNHSFALLGSSGLIVYCTWYQSYRSLSKRLSNDMQVLSRITYSHRQLGLQPHLLGLWKPWKSRISEKVKGVTYLSFVLTASTIYLI